MGEIIDKTNRNVLEKVYKTSPIVNIDAKRGTIYFRVNAIKLMGIKKGDYIKFYRDKNFLFVFKTNKSQSSYRLTNAATSDSRTSNLKITSAPLVKYLVNDIFYLKGLKGRASYYINKTETELDGNTLYEILIHKPIAKLGK